MATATTVVKVVVVVVMVKVATVTATANQREMYTTVLQAKNFSGNYSVKAKRTENDVNMNFGNHRFRLQFSFRCLFGKYDENFPDGISS